MEELHPESNNLDQELLSILEQELAREEDEAKQKPQVIEISNIDASNQQDKEPRNQELEIVGMAYPHWTKEQIGSIKGDIEKVTTVAKFELQNLQDKTGIAKENLLWAKDNPLEAAILSAKWVKDNPEKALELGLDVANLVMYAANPVANTVKGKLKDTVKELEGQYRLLDHDDHITITKPEGNNSNAPKPSGTLDLIEINTGVKIEKPKQHEEHSSNLYTQDYGQHQNYKVELRRQMEKPYVEDSNLTSIMNDLYRKTDNPIGSGSTAEALRQEMQTGTPTKGKWHKQKVENYIDGLTSWLKNSPNASTIDKTAAENVLLDLLDAYRGVNNKK